MTRLSNSAKLFVVLAAVAGLSSLVNAFGGLPLFSGLSVIGHAFWTWEPSHNPQLWALLVLAAGTARMIEGASAERPVAVVAGN